MIRWTNRHIEDQRYSILLNGFFNTILLKAAIRPVTLTGSNRPFPDGHSSHIFGISLATFPWQDALFMDAVRLEKRNSERRAAFKKMREFWASGNEFLDNKTLVIGQRTGNARVRSFVAFETAVGHTYRMAALSYGERQILTMLFSASRSKVSSGVFLIDEPELSLHIDWQRIILRELTRQSEDRQIIACTALQ